MHSSLRVIGGTSSLSQHALANAIDLHGFTLADASVYTVYDHWEDGVEAPVTGPGCVVRVKGRMRLKIPRHWLQRLPARHRLRNSLPRHPLARCPSTLPVLLRHGCTRLRMHVATPLLSASRAELGRRA